MIVKFFKELPYKFTTNFYVKLVCAAIFLFTILVISFKYGKGHIEILGLFIILIILFGWLDIKHQQDDKYIEELKELNEVKFKK